MIDSKKDRHGITRKNWYGITHKYL